MGICALRAPVLSFIFISSFSSFSAQSDGFPTLSTSLGNAEPLVLLPSPPVYPKCSGGECRTFLPWVSGWQTHRGELTSSHPIDPFAETTALWHDLVPPRQAGKGGCFVPYTEQFVISRCQGFSQSCRHPGSAPQWSHVGWLEGHVGVLRGQASFECHIIS